MCSFYGYLFCFFFFLVDVVRREVHLLFLRAAFFMPLSNRSFLTYLKKNCKVSQAWEEEDDVGSWRPCF